MGRFPFKFRRPVKAERTWRVDSKNSSGTCSPALDTAYEIYADVLGTGVWDWLLDKCLGQQLADRLLTTKIEKAFLISKKNYDEEHAGSSDESESSSVAASDDNGDLPVATVSTTPGLVFDDYEYPVRYPLTGIGRYCRSANAPKEWVEEHIIKNLSYLGPYARKNIELIADYAGLDPEDERLRRREIIGECDPLSTHGETPTEYGFDARSNTPPPLSDGLSQDTRNLFLAEVENVERQEAYSLARGPSNSLLPDGPLRYANEEDFCAVGTCGSSIFRQKVQLSVAYNEKSITFVDRCRGCDERDKGKKPVPQKRLYCPPASSYLEDNAVPSRLECGKSQEITNQSKRLAVARETYVAEEFNRAYKRWVTYWRWSRPNKKKVRELEDITEEERRRLREEVEAVHRIIVARKQRAAQKAKAEQERREREARLGGKHSRGDVGGLRRIRSMPALKPEPMYDGVDHLVRSGKFKTDEAVTYRFWLEHQGDKIGPEDALKMVAETLNKTGSMLNGKCAMRAKSHRVVSTIWPQKQQQEQEPNYWAKLRDHYQVTTGVWGKYYKKRDQEDQLRRRGLDPEIEEAKIVKPPIYPDHKSNMIDEMEEYKIPDTKMFVNKIDPLIPCEPLDPEKGRVSMPIRFKGIEYEMAETFYDVYMMPIP